MTSMRWYRLGEGSLGIASADEALDLRFREIYGQCAVDAPGKGPVVTCRVSRPEGGAVRITFDDPEPLDLAAFLSAVFPERDYRVRPAPPGGHQLQLPGTQDVVLLQSAAALEAPAHAAWQPLVANLAVSRLLRLQRHLLFFHAASFAVRGRGFLLCGPKRSGKTTMALAFAAAGHDLLGDEVAVLRPDDRTLLPFPRSLAVREGPVSAATQELLDGADLPTERFPDGEVRRRVLASRVGTTATDRVPLTTVLVLRHFSGRTAVRPIPKGAALIGLLTPMAVSLWERSAGSLAVSMLRALAGALAFEVDLGPPDEARSAIEQLLEA